MKKAIKFEASWCQPCKMYTPVWESVKQDYTDWEWETVDINKDAETTEKYGITSIPTTIILVNGEEVERRGGIINKPDLKGILDSYNN